ncbi:MAG TPA: phosphotransferase [Chitinophagaceae bacterium]|nr:phosphotransferase [Chitinophagaceae bacterium]
MMPENKQEAVTRALQTAFGVTRFDTIEQLTAGLSTALIYKITVKGRAYLLRVITSTDAIADPEHQYVCMGPAAEAGIAPQVVYYNREDRVIITDFIPAVPFPLAVAREKMPALLRRLHALPPFPKRMVYLDAINGFMQRFKTAGLVPAETIDTVFTAYERITAAYPRNAEEYVSCHNDVKAENILYDGERVWLVDWEAGFLNDRYLDLGMIANFIVRDEADEKHFLEAYFNGPVSEYEYARFYLFSQMLHMFYFSFLLLNASGGKAADAGMPRPGYREFHEGMWHGEISIAGNDARLQYAWVHYDELQRNLSGPRFEESLRIVAGSNKAMPK